MSASRPTNPPLAGLASPEWADPTPKSWEDFNDVVVRLTKTPFTHSSIATPAQTLSESLAVLKRNEAAMHKFVLLRHDELKPAVDALVELEPRFAAMAQETARKPTLTGNVPALGCSVLRILVEQINATIDQHIFPFILDNPEPFINAQRSRQPSVVTSHSVGHRVLRGRDRNPGWGRYDHY